MRGPESTFIVPAAAADGAVDRAATVGRHLVRLRTLDPRSPLQVGNGEFAIAVDPTGLQTFPEKYPVEGGGSLLGTMAQWAWHSLPSPRTYSLVEAIRDYVTPRGSVPYVDLGDEMHDGASQTEAETWLRGNPHKLQLATIGLWTGDSTPLDAGSLSDIDQQLDLWSGIVESRFALAGGRYSTTTAAHPERDAVAFKLTGPPGAPLGVRLRFPYGSDAWADASDWTKPEAHTTQVERLPDGWLLTRRLDETSYQVLVRATGSEMQRLGEHDLVFSAAGEAEVVIEFVRGAADRRLDDETPSDERPKDESPPDEGPSDECPSGQPRPASNDSLSAAAVLAASSRYWASFWSSGAFVDLSGSSDRRACELERRIVLSQYLTAVNCAGSLPPAETGLLLNSWRGKFHLEMHIFHALHFAAWGRPQLLERSLGWYLDALKVARETAVRQGYDGARWPKQVGPAGQETPSSIGPFLVWQQPHLIYLLEMLYRADPVVACSSATRNSSTTPLSSWRASRTRMNRVSTSAHPSCRRRSLTRPPARAPAIRRSNWPTGRGR